MSRDFTHIDDITEIIYTVDKPANNKFFNFDNLIPMFINIGYLI